MTSLNTFIEPIKIADNPIGDEYQAYKMDSSEKSNNMRRMVELGTCHCCDYFLPDNDKIILLEETQLLKKVEGIRKEYHYLNGTDMDKAVNDRIRDRMQLKAYGTMLVLCRLMAKFSSAKTLIQDKKYHFWLVVSSINSEDERRYFDNLKDSLRGTLKQVLGAKLLDDVDVLSSDTLEDKLPIHDPPP